ARGILINGQWTHREIVSARSYTYYRLAACGCGLCAAAMAISAKTGRLVLPTRFNSPRYDFTGTTYKTMFSVKCAKAFGLQGKVTTMTRRQLIDHMLRGRMVIVWVKRSIYGGGGNTRGGDTGATGHTHWILIHGYKNGKFAVADSNNRSQSYVTSGNLKSWFTFNSHLGAGKKRSYTVISWNKWWE
ncbi:MAG: C39 family peptidase, partial [Eubacterium sp.]|nr:C39 family peptidase [Eubacterium sp.]